MSTNDGMFLAEPLEAMACDLRNEDPDRMIAMIYSPSQESDRKMTESRLRLAASDDERDRIVLRHVLFFGAVDAAYKAGPIDSWAVTLAERGYVAAYDRLALMYELTPAGHRRLAELDPHYRPPRSLFMMDRWTDAEALVCQAANLVSGVYPGRRKPKGREPRLSVACEGVLVAEQRRLASEGT